MNRKLSDIIAKSISEYHLSHLRGQRGTKHAAPAATHRWLVCVIVIATAAGVWIADAVIARFCFASDSFVNLLLLYSPGFMLYHRVLLCAAAVVIVLFGRMLVASRNLDTALKRSSKWFSTTLKSIGAALIAVDRQGKIIFMNPFAEELTAWRQGHAIGKPLIDVCHINQAGTNRPIPLDTHLQRVVDQRTVSSLSDVGILEAANGQKPYVTGSLAPILDETNEVIGAVLVLHDITQIRDAEEEIRRLATVVEQAADLIVIAGVDGTIEYANPSVERTTGYDKKELVGRTIGIFKNDRHPESFFQELHDTLLQANIWQGRFTLVAKDKRDVQLELLASAIIDANGKAANYVAVSRDITRQLELQSQLNQAQKMEAMGRMASGIAHDFNNILSIISGFTELLATDSEQKDAAKEWVGEITTAVDKGSALIEQLLAFSRQDKRYKQVIIPLDSRIQGLEKMLGQLVRQTVVVALQLNAPAGSVKLDPGQLDQAVINMVKNASDAMPDGGHVYLQTSTATVRRRGELGLDLSPGKYVTLSILDTGCGIDAALLPRIFEPFYTTKDIGEGTGLGLAMVYGFIRQVGGDIKVTSEVGKGSRFDLYFPAAT